MRVLYEEVEEVEEVVASSTRESGGGEGVFA
jgi:hypothetical protein